MIATNGSQISVQHWKVLRKSEISVIWQSSIHGCLFLQYTRDSLQREARASGCFLQRAREGIPPCLTWCKACYCFKFERTLSHSSRGKRTIICKERWRARCKGTLVGGNLFRRNLKCIHFSGDSFVAFFFSNVRLPTSFWC